MLQPAANQGSAWNKKTKQILGLLLMKCHFTFDFYVPESDGYEPPFWLICVYSLQQRFKDTITVCYYLDTHDLF